MASIVQSAAYKDGQPLGEVSIDQIGELLRQPGHFVWLGLHEPPEPLLQRIQAEFGLHELAIGDAHQRPKIEAYADSLLIVLKTAHREAGQVANNQNEVVKLESISFGIALSQPEVRDVGRVLSMYVGPADALVTLDLDFDEGTTAVDATVAVAAVGRRVRERFPVIQRLFIESGSPALPQRWVRPDAVRTVPEGTAAY